jgi:hypothetical protein
MKYSEQEMASLINEVETQFADYLAKAEVQPEQSLQKTEIEEVNEELAKTENNVELDYDADDYVEMDKLYQSMSKAEQEAHYKSLKKSLFVEEVKIEKKEKVVVKEEKLEKAEFDIVKEENAELKKNLEKLTAAFTKFIQKPAPKRKAITKIEYIKKNEVEVSTDGKPVIDVSKLSKNEISNKLTEKIRSGNLQKSDREAIDNYCLSDKPSIDSIKHLL